MNKTNKIRKLISLWLPVLFWCWLIYFLSSIPNLRIEALGFWDFIFRKFAHIGEYAILVLFLFRAFRGRLYFWPGFLSFVYASTDELHQLFVPTRGPSLVDMLIDTSGAAIMLIVIKISEKNSKKVVEKNEQLRKS
ncbi:MAG: VanZ family protein [Elusimicrobia bacterium]|nr:VanZ family protein [Elusimicrobiota bacterium]